METRMNSSTPLQAAAGARSAADLRRRMAEREAAKAAEEVQRMQEQEERQKAVMEEFQKPPSRTTEQVMASVMRLVDHAAEYGASEVQVYQFPSSICTDRGRAINHFSSDWPTTLTGRAQLAYRLWLEHLKPLGFGLKAQIL